MERRSRWRRSRSRHVGASGAAAEPGYSFDTTPGKLPKTVVPLHYAIELEPNLERLTLAGAEVVDIEVREPTARLVLNAVSMTLTSATIDNETQSASIALDADAETATLTFPQPLAVGPHKLRISFTARINTFGRGLFFVDYPTDKGSKRMISSHLEPADARRIFPSWDEPAFKATFALTVTVPRSFLAVSNMPVAKEEPVTPALKQVSFMPTPRMSSYLFVLTAGELERLTAQADGVAISVVTTTGKRQQGRFALDSAVALLRYFNDYFGVKYPLPKLDLIAVPGRLRRRHGELGRDHLLREPAPVRSGIERGRRPARHLQHPRPRDGASMVRQSRHHGLVGQSLAQRGFRQLDASQGRRAFPSAVADLAQRQRPEAIRHDLGRAAYLAPDPAAGRQRDRGDGGFRRHHLQQGAGADPHARALSRRRLRSAPASANTWPTTPTATPLPRICGGRWRRPPSKPVATVAAAFTEQAGVPLVVAEVTCAGEEQRIVLRQDRFTVRDPDAAPRRWQVPVAIGPLRAPARGRDRAARRIASEIVAGRCGEPVKLNLGDVGYYRVEYDAASRAALAKSLALMAPADRVNLLADSWALVEAGRAEPHPISS